jgi:alkyl hydroperoxide reductase subunit AhpC
MVRQLAGAAAVIVLAAGALVLSRGWSWPVSMAAAGDEAALPAAAPEFPEKAVWAQGDPLKLADLKGRVVVVHFWTNGCINCARNYPVYKSWQEKYDARKVALIGVHTPEFDHEAPAERVRAAARTNGLKFPIVLDNDKAIWNAWDNHYWPAIYLVDKRGRVRYRWEGELHLDTAEGKAFAKHIDELAAE